jgi:hypothetical protein
MNMDMSMNKKSLSTSTSTSKSTSTSTSTPISTSASTSLSTYTSTVGIFLHGDGHIHIHLHAHAHAHGHYGQCNGALSRHLVEFSFFCFVSYLFCYICFNADSYPCFSIYFIFISHANLTFQFSNLLKLIRSQNCYIRFKVVGGHFAPHSPAQHPTIS